MNAAQSASLGLGGELVLGDFALEIFANGFDCAFQKPLFDVAQHHLEPATRQHMRNAVAHGPRADNTDSLNLHDFASRENVRVYHLAWNDWELELLWVWRGKQGCE
jgi:hypothetical protein